MNNTAARRWLRLFWLSTVLMLAVSASLVPHLRNSAEMVRMRNALLVRAQPADFAWTPATVPADFAIENAAPLSLYAQAVARHGLSVAGDDWATALAIGRHLLPDGKRSGGPIQAGLAETYVRITQQREGYCGDYADSFTGLANAAGIFSRPWAFSFDGFGGYGHIFNEVWDRQHERWIMIDVFNNFYVAGADGEPLSAMAFREALEDGRGDLRLMPVDPAAQPGFALDARALAYYRQGLPEWYMWWGNNVFEYDSSPIVVALGKVHRAFEQLGGVAAGVYPQIRILEAPENAAQRNALRWLQLRLVASAVLGALSVLCLAGWLLARRRKVRGVR